MILSDRSLREELASGRIEVDPLDESCIQPSSIDLRLDHFFRVFLNHTVGMIDVKADLEDLTQLVEVSEDDVFILHPGEFVLGSTRERIKVPDDLVARIEGKSSLGRLGLLIHSSLPASEMILVLDDHGLRPMAVGDVVRKQLRGCVVSFDPETFEVGYHEITGWYEGPKDRIYEVRLASGRTVRVTAGHNLFTLDRAGELRKVRTGELQAGMRIAVPRSIPEPPLVDSASTVDVLALAPEQEHERFTITGPSVAAAFVDHSATIEQLLRESGRKHVDYYRERALLPLVVARQIPGLVGGLTSDDRVGVRGGRNTVPARFDVTGDIAWMLGLYVAEGYRRRNQLNIANTDQVILDRVVSTMESLGLPSYRSDGAITCCSSIMSSLFDWIGTGGHSHEKRIPPCVFGWPRKLVESFLEGLVDGDGSRTDIRTTVWTSSPGLAADTLLLFTRLGLRAGTCKRIREHGPAWQVYAAINEHKLLTSVPLPDQLLIELRRDVEGEPRARLDRLIDGGLLWDTVVEVRQTDDVETIYDIEVRPDGRKIENFVAGTGGVFVSNTAGFIDAGFNGHITLELSNVANLPITLYPGMKIGQISFLRMTTPADNPYGSGTLGSKYQGQRGPTPSRYWENFRNE